MYLNRSFIFLAVTGSEIMASPVIDVYVKLPSGKTTQFDLFPTDRVQTIYSKTAGILVHTILLFI